MLNLPDAEADFYPRPPRGGRPARERGSQKWRTISIHALREEGDQSSVCSSSMDLIFLSTPSARRATSEVVLPSLSS